MELITISAGITAPLFFQKSGQPDSAMSAIRKLPVSTAANPQPCQVRPMGLVGDEQADLTVHGGLDKALYLYPAEHYPFWQTVCQQAKVSGLSSEAPFAHGKMGENLTIKGILESRIWIGDQLQMGSAVLRVESPRNPCFKFNIAMGFTHAVKMMIQSGFCGFYCSVIQPGILTAGDKITILAGSRTLSIEARFALTNRTLQRNLF